MFSEYRELISQLKANDRHFENLFSKHHELDQKIQLMEAHIEPASHEEIEILKKTKLRLKDEMYELLKKADSTQAV
ncbi:MAG: YdcH family protein [Burkholderiales bacterium]|nr:YdcH family protein [Burkholderiales bacterium]